MDLDNSDLGFIALRHASTNSLLEERVEKHLLSPPNHLVMSESYRRIRLSYQSISASIRCQIEIWTDS